MTEIAITVDTLIGRSDAVLASELDGETIMMDIEKGVYLGLNLTGSRIWSMLEEPMPVRGVCEQLALQFNVSAQTCDEEVLAFLTDLLERNVIQVVEAEAV